MNEGASASRSVTSTPHDTDERLTRLFEELHIAPAEADDTASDQAEELLDAIEATVAPDADLHFDQGVVKQSLDEMLVVLIALRSREAHGKALMEDLSRLFDSDLSPGSVYPRLHEMDDDGILEMFELVQSKEYRIDDREQAVAMATAAARQHLAVGAFLHAAASDL